MATAKARKSVVNAPIQQPVDAVQICDLILSWRDLEIHIRNQFGLLQNKPLLENSGKKFDPDWAVAMIIETLWKRCRRSEQPVTVAVTDKPSR